MQELYADIMKLELPEKYSEESYTESKPKKEINFESKDLIDFH